MNKLNNLLLKSLGTIACVGLTSHQTIAWAEQKQQKFNQTIIIPSQIIAVNNPTIQIIEQEAQKLYQQSKYTEAIALLTKAIAQYGRKGDLVGKVIATRNLALIYHRLGKWEQAEKTLSQAQAVIETIDSDSLKSQLWAQLLEVQGQVELSLGRSPKALATWQQATLLYQQQNNLTGFTQGKIYQAYALQALGLYAQSIKTLTAVNQQLAHEPDSLPKAQALLKIGDILNRVGKYAESRTILTASLTIAKKLDSKPTIATILLSLGKHARLTSQPEQALEFYQQAINIASQPDIVIAGKLAQLNTLISLQQIAQAKDLSVEIGQILGQMPAQQTTIAAKIGLASSWLALDTKPQNVVPHLVSAVKEARQLNLSRTEAEALGLLGKIYEDHQQWRSAQRLTERALLIAQTIKAQELTYQWQWQLGRILKAQGKKREAIAAYTQATNNLQSLRGDLVAISSDLQYSFRSEIEPVYRELAALLLQPNASQTDLNQARQIIESLQLAELDNFFRDACLNTEPVQLEEVDPNAAIIYTIILGNRLEVIAAIPGQPLSHYSHELPPSELKISVTSAINQINKPRRFNLQPFQQAYDWLIRPLESHIQAHDIQTLVFVADGILRNLPPATFHDGKQYLVEKYNIALAPSLQLVELKTTEASNQDILLAGLSQPSQGFSALPGVRREINQIESLVSAQVLLDRSFTEINFTNATTKIPFRVVHLATHGQFSSNAEETFILTWDDRINIDELGSLLRGDSKKLRPVDLLVLSACETAKGDSLAALGLAGIAVRAGARSTLASLWAVSDEATVPLMTSFYQELVQGETSKAEALRNAQISMLKQEQFSHPFYWSAFVLITCFSSFEFNKL